MENEMELTIMRLITAAGDARSLAIQAIRAARAGPVSYTHLAPCSINGFSA